MRLRRGQRSVAVWIKNKLLAGASRCPQKIPVGLYRGLVLSLDLHHQSQTYAGLSEAETHRFIRAAAPRTRWMIDVGAGQGELAIYFAAKSSVSRVFAIDPQETEIEVLNENIGLNRESVGKKIQILRKFAGLAATDDFVQLDALSVDRKLRGFIKIDVDGYEMEVLESGKGLISEAPVDLLIETHSVALEQDCIQWLEARGFAPTIVPNAWWRRMLPEQRPIEHNRWLWAASG